VNEATEAVAILLVLTPDDGRPPELAKLSDARVVWTSFSMLDQAIDELLDDKYEVVSEREAFLLRALQTMLAEEGLLANPNDVVIVAARNAWPEYIKAGQDDCGIGWGYLTTEDTEVHRGRGWASLE
jgi:hypothetical protein